MASIRYYANDFKQPRRQIDTWDKQSGFSDWQHSDIFAYKYQ